MRRSAVLLLALTALTGCSDATPEAGSADGPRLQVRAPEPVAQDDGGEAVVTNEVVPAPTSPDKRADDPASIADDLEKGGDVMVRRGDLPGAIVRYARSVQTSRDLVEDDPQDAARLTALVRRLEKAAYACRLAGRVDQAIVLYREHVRYAGQLLGQVKPGAKDPAVRPADVLRSLQTVGDLQLQRGRAADALASFQAALERLERAPESEKQGASFRRNLSVAHGRVAYAQQQLEKFDEGRASWARSMELARAVASFGPDAAELRQELAGVLTGAAALERAAGEPEAAAKLLTEALVLQRSLVDAAGGAAHPAMRHGVSVAAARLARLELERGRAASAHPLARESLELLEEVLPQMQNPLGALNEKASRHTLLADIARATQDWDEAVAQEALGLKVLESLVEQSDGAASAWRACAQSHAALAGLHGKAEGDASGSRSDKIEHHRTRARQAAAQAVARDPDLAHWERQLVKALNDRPRDESEGRVR